MSANLQISVDGLGRAKPKMRVLTMTESASTTFGGIVGGLPVRVVQECTEPIEMVTVQVQLLSVQRDNCRTGRVSLPHAVALFGVRRSPSFATFIVPNSKPRLEERARRGEGGAHGPRQETREPLGLLDCQVPWPMQKECARQT